MLDLAFPFVLVKRTRVELIAHQFGVKVLKRHGVGCFCPSHELPAFTMRTHPEWLLFPGGGLVIKLCPTLVTPWTIACQVPLSMEFSRQEYWSRLPFLSPGDLLQPSGWTWLSHIAGRFFTDRATREAQATLTLMSVFPNFPSTSCGGYDYAHVITSILWQIILLTHWFSVLSAHWGHQDFCWCPYPSSWVSDLIIVRSSLGLGFLRAL